MHKSAVIAIGGNALVKAGQAGSIAEQMGNATEIAEQLVKLIRDGWQIALVHGNGPQVGFILRRTEEARDVAPVLSLDMCGADSQGGIGYILQQALGNTLRDSAIPANVAAIITQVEVDPGDAAFQNPTKPIGQFYTEAEAQRYAREEGWTVVQDAGRGWRRVVPSPRPIRFVEADVIRTMVGAGVITICAGGGGIPVVRANDGLLHGVEAVVDKDFASALLARMIEADVLLITTSVERVTLNYGEPTQRPLDRLTVLEAERYMEEGHFPPGNMGPKMMAAIEFVRDSGGSALITDFANVEGAMKGEIGTRLVP